MNVNVELTVRDFISYLDKLETVLESMNFLQVYIVETVPGEESDVYNKALFSFSVENAKNFVNSKILDRKIRKIYALDKNKICILVDHEG